MQVVNNEAHLGFSVELKRSLAGTRPWDRRRGVRQGDGSRHARRLPPPLPKENSEDAPRLCYQRIAVVSMSMSSVGVDVVCRIYLRKNYTTIS